jgi:hypothetical protein
MATEFLLPLGGENYRMERKKNVFVLCFSQEFLSVFLIKMDTNCIKVK